MNKLCCLIVMFITCGACSGQNLVPNGDFEQYSSCPNSASQLDSALFWNTPSFGTSDYFNQCDLTNIVSVPQNILGYQNAYSGVAYSGIFLWGTGNYPEYLETQLLSSLSANGCYHFEMFVSLSNNSGIATDAIGVYFSNQLIFDSTWNNLTYVPQINNMSGFITDTLNWTLISGNYTASGGESHIVIGNFKSNTNTDTMRVNIFGATFSYVYIDSVSLTPCTGVEEQNKNTEIKIYPNPFNEKLTFRKKNNALSEIILYDITARKIFKQSFTNSTTINTEQLAKGIYLYEVRNKNGVVKKGKIVKD